MNKRKQQGKRIPVLEFGINGKGEYKMFGNKTWMDPVLTFVKSEIKQLSKQLQYRNFGKNLSNSVRTKKMRGL